VTTPRHSARSAPWLPGPADLALSPDEKTIYATSLREGDRRSNAVYRFGWSDARPQVFVTGETGADESLLSNPRGIAVDGEGQVYVADNGNNRVAVFRPDGTFRGALPVELPERVAVHSQTGAVYVVAGQLKNQVLKFSSWEIARPIAELKLPSFKHPDYTALLALDASAEQPILWVASPRGHYAKMDLLRIEDGASGFGAPIDVGKRTLAAKPTAGPVLGMDLDRQRGRLFVGCTTSRMTPGAKESPKPPAPRPTTGASVPWGSTAISTRRSIRGSFAASAPI
jgi:hypothetical protein